MDRPGFKPGGWRHALPGGFDSHSLPPSTLVRLPRGRFDMNVLGFDFPDALHYHVEHQVWARLDADARVTVGITALGIRLSGEIYMCRPKGIGQVVEQGRSVAVVELAKAIVSVKSPLSGQIVEINHALAAAPELVHLEPYGRGWLVRLQASAWDAEREALVHGAAVDAAMRHHAWLNNVEPL